MVYAQIKDGMIINTIVVDEKTNLKLFREGFDELIRIDDLKQKPGPEWMFDGKEFTSPEHDPDLQKFPWPSDKANPGIESAIAELPQK